MEKKSILILGKIPPPSGGVTVHVHRLLERLDREACPYEFYSLSNRIQDILRKALKYKYIHLHTSHVYFRFLFALFCRLSHRLLMQTYHNNLGRFRWYKNMFEYASIRISSIPIVINAGSFEKARKLNNSSRFISSFIAPVEQASLPDAIEERLQAWEKSYEIIFCTNASCLKYDIYGQEIYGGSSLFEIFSRHPHMGFIFSDPSGEYSDFLENKYGRIPENIHLIPEEHGFLEILKRSSCFIRASTTDGDSLSVKEALWLGMGVIASDCVDRPEGCILFPTSDFSALEQVLLVFRGREELKSPGLDGFNDIFDIYKSKLSK